MVKKADKIQQTEQRPEWCGRKHLNNLVCELERQAESKRDVVADGRALRVTVDNGAVRLSTDRAHWKADAAGSDAIHSLEQGLRMTDSAVAQLCNRLTPSVPVEFARKLIAEHPGEAASLLGGVLKEDAGMHLVRMLDGKVRALMSNKYRILDHYDVAMASLKAVRESNGVVLSGELSERNMRIKFTTPDMVGRVEDEMLARPGTHWVNFGDKGREDRLALSQLGTSMPTPYGAQSVFPAVSIVNSETGHGSFRVQYGVILAYCGINYSVMSEVKSEIHLGGILPLGVMRPETIDAKSRVITMEAVDAIRAAFTPEIFNPMIDRLNNAAASKIPDQVEAVDNVMRMAPIHDGERDALLAYFLGDYSRTRFGLGQAVSRLAQDIEDTDRAADLEETAGRLMVAA